jgi:hypothetical protein
MVSTMRAISIFLIFAILEWAVPCQNACAFDRASFDADQFIERLQTGQSITFEMAEIRRHWNELSDTEKAKLSRYYVPEPLAETDKPVFAFWKTIYPTSIEGAKTLTTDHFRIIWGENYKEYVNKFSAYYTYWGDPDLDGYPTFIERLAGTDPYNADDPGDNPDFSNGICETVWAKVIEEMGFNPPDGSDEHYIDVYIANTGVKNTAVDSGLIELPGQVYGMAATYQNGMPYIVLNQDMGINALKVTFAHEFFHNIQFSYLPLDNLLQDKNLWLAESTAVWMEDAVYPTINDYKQYVDYWTSWPQQSLFSSDSFSHYGGVIFQKYLTENYHLPDDLDGSEIIKAIWEHAAQTADPIEAINLFLAEQTIHPIKDFDDAYVDFALKNLDIKQNYADGSLYNPVYFVMDFEMDTFEETLYDTLNDDQISDNDLPELYGANYIKVSLKENDISALSNRLTFNFKGEGSLDNTQPEWHVFIIPEAEDGTLYPALQVDVKNNDQEGAFIKEDPRLYRAAHVVIAATPAQDQVFTTAKKFAYNFNANSYVATRLTGGWNLVNIPASGKEYLEKIQPSTASAWRWDSDNQNWQVSFPNQADEFTNLYISKKGLTNLTDFENNDGVWLLSQEKGVEVTFSEPEQIQSIPLNKGWNLAGMNKLTSYDVSVLKDSLWCNSIWKWNALQNTWEIYLSGFDIETLKAYVESKGFLKLDRIYYGEGFWINSLESDAELILE